MNIKRATKIILAATVLASSVVYAKAAMVALPVKVANCDLIAKVEILSTAQTVPYYVASEQGKEKPTPPKWRALEPGEYRSSAKVKVIRAIKGLKAGEVYTLEFDNGFICPNVLYLKGDECLVFNRKLPSGHYETYNTYFGKYPVKDNKVVGWKQGAETLLDEVAAEITDLMRKTKEAPK